MPRSHRRAAIPSRRRILDSENPPANAAAPDRQRTIARRETTRETADKCPDNQDDPTLFVHQPHYFVRICRPTTTVD